MKVSLWLLSVKTSSMPLNQRNHFCMRMAYFTMSYQPLKGWLQSKQNVLLVPH